ncbi:hypothetical protein Pfo_003527 [Paulownia fortunei]|nr:hypothetical protein Pfo_003527 [Paulownia fortunei]
MIGRTISSTCPTHASIPIAALSSRDGDDGVTNAGRANYLTWPPPPLHTASVRKRTPSRRGGMRHHSPLEIASGKNLDLTALRSYKYPKSLSAPSHRPSGSLLVKLRQTAIEGLVVPVVANPHLFLCRDINRSSSS